MHPLQDDAVRGAPPHWPGAARLLLILILGAALSCNTTMQKTKLRIVQLGVKKGGMLVRDDEGETGELVVVGGRRGKLTAGGIIMR